MIFFGPTESSAPTSNLLLPCPYADLENPAQKVREQLLFDSLNAALLRVEKGGFCLSLHALHEPDESLTALRRAFVDAGVLQHGGKYRAHLLPQNFLRVFRRERMPRL